MNLDQSGSLNIRHVKLTRYFNYIFSILIYPFENFLNKAASPGKSLTPQFWHNVSVLAEKDDKVLTLYKRFRDRRGDDALPCDHECKRKLICAMRAGKSELGCIGEMSKVL
jgi:hypothetical protein